MVSGTTVRIGLTGKICSGKSIIAAMLQAKGAYVVYADDMAHATYAPGTVAFDQLVATFGECIVKADGTIDRTRLRSLVLGSEINRRKLERLIWPATLAIVNKAMRAVSGIVVLEAAALIEADWLDTIDIVWLVNTEREVACQRAPLKGISVQDFERFWDIQHSHSERLARVQHRGKPWVEIDNNSSLCELQERVDELWATLPSLELKG